MRSSDESELPACSPVVFVFFDPWTLCTGRLAGMVRHILDRGFRLLDFEFQTLSEADAEEIYRTNHPIREENSWHVARLVYPMGRSLGLLLGLNDAHSCACQRMQRLKGKANPSLNQAGQLRYDFKAPNRCLSLMHSSDNLMQVRREAAVFFSADRIDRACAAAVNDSTFKSTAKVCDLSDASGELGLERIEEPGVGVLFARMRLRMTKALRGTCTGPSAWLEALSAYQGLWEPLSRESVRKPVTAEATQYLQILIQERPLLNAIGVRPSVCDLSGGRRVAEFYRPPYHEPSLVLQCLQVLNRPELYPKWDSETQVPRNMLYDQWERLLFRTHLFNFDDLLSVAG